MYFGAISELPSFPIAQQLCYNATQHDAPLENQRNDSFDWRSRDGQMRLQGMMAFLGVSGELLVASQAPQYSYGVRKVAS